MRRSIRVILIHYSNIWMHVYIFQHLQCFSVKLFVILLSFANTVLVHYISLIIFLKVRQVYIQTCLCVLISRPSNIWILCQTVSWGKTMQNKHLSKFHGRGYVYTVYNWLSGRSTSILCTLCVAHQWPETYTKVYR